MLLAVLTAVGVSWAPAPPVAEDSLEAIQHVVFLLGHYYPTATRAPGRGRGFSRSAALTRCDAERGDICYAGDPDAGPCPNFVQCHLSPKHMVETITKAAMEHPTSGYLTGQAVYILTKEGRLPEAGRVVDRCAAAEWWCHALRGYVLHAQGRDPQAAATFRRALGDAPDSVACAWSDATWLLGEWDQRGSDQSTVDAHDDAAGWSCQRRLAVSDSIWWLADPLYSVPGNDRWVEHLFRTMSARFYAEIREAHAGSIGTRAFAAHLWGSRVRRGPVDSYDAERTWTSRQAARYHFVPEVTAGDLDHPSWTLDAHFDDEGYTPGYEPVVPVPHQAARFLEGESLAVVVASRIAGTRLAGALDQTASFVLTDGPQGVPVILSTRKKGATLRFSGLAPMRRYVASLEVVTSKGVGWDRRVMTPLAEAGPEVSDLLLYDTGKGQEPADRAEAAGRMRGSTSVEKGGVVGVYWETYGASPGDSLRFDLSVERRSGGLVDRLSRLLPGGSQEGRGRVTWTEPARGSSHSSAVALSLASLDSGDYTLALTVSWGDGAPVRRQRHITVE